MRPPSSSRKTSRRSTMTSRHRHRRQHAAAKKHPLPLRQRFPALRMVLGDPRPHLVIPGLGRGDVAAGVARGGDKAFGEGGFPRPGAADDQGKGRK